MEVGIEKLRMYPTSLKLNLSELATERNFDLDYLTKDLMVQERVRAQGQGAPGRPEEGQEERGYLRPLQGQGRAGLGLFGLGGRLRRLGLLGAERARWQKRWTSDQKSFA